ncbi:ryncolin-1-like [Saccostrea echinata]|uniref:ryncolin-1-like n=1 Tax=Saccostrea echinata TaxID=191078 RepID=UPI002A7ED8E5|nr:ryncolin-1-like [Saccostrea echinata]
MTGESLPQDCKDFLENGQINSGVFEIYPYGTVSSPVKVYCDMETMDGGWTVIQKRVDGSQSFNKNWAEYKNGFGSPEQDVWIGNDVINQLTKENDSSLYVTITLENGETKYELYDQFSVSDEAEKYKLFLAGNATGTLGDRMRNPGDPPLHLPGMYFSTPDRDNDHDAGSCAAGLKGGWWFNRCHQAFLNGLWASDDWAFPWYPIDKGTPIRKTVMMVKRR